METGRASARQIQPKICELCGGRQRCLGIQMTNSLLAFFLAGNFVHFKTGTFLCVFVMSKLIFIRWHFSANSLQIWKWKGRKSILQCDTGKICIAQTAVRPCCAFLVHLFTLPEWNQFGGSLNFLFLRHETRARRTNTHCTVHLPSP